MKGGKPSQTAEYAAFARAFESSRRRSATRLFNDPFAYSFLRPRFKAAILLSRVPLLGAVERWFIEQGYRGELSSGVGRTRLIDDYLSASLHDGIDQVVILGAGFAVALTAYRPSNTSASLRLTTLPPSRRKKRGCDASLQNCLRMSHMSTWISTASH